MSVTTPQPARRRRDRRRPTDVRSRGLDRRAPSRGPPTAGSCASSRHAGEAGPTGLPGRPVPRPRDLLAAVQRAGAAARRPTSRAAARAGPLPRDLRQQPRRVLHGARRRASSAASPPASPCAPPPGSSRARCSSRSPLVAHELHGACRPRSSRTRCGRPSRTRASDRPLGRAERGRAGAAAPTCSPTGSSRCSPRWPSTRPTRSPTSPACRSTSPSCSVNPKTGNEHFARVKVPPLLPRFIHVEPRPASRRRPTCTTRGSSRSRTSSPPTSTSSSPGMEVREHFTFRVTRNEDLEVEEDDAENLLTALEKELTRRRFGPPVRLEVDEDIDDHVLDLLVRELSVTDSEVYRLPAPLDLRGLNLVADLERSDLRYPPFVPTTHPDLAPAESSKASDILAVVREQGRPAPAPLRLVLDVGAGLHRAGRGRPQRARHQADALPHQRRLPDRRRPHRRRRGRQAGAGRRRDQGPLRRGEQHLAGPASWSTPASTSSTASSGSRPTPSCASSSARRPRACAATATSAPATTTRKTARLYEDFGLLTCDPQVGEDLTRLFNQLSGFAPRSKFKRLLVAPRVGALGPDRAHRGRDRATPRPGRRRPASASRSTRSSTRQLIDALYRASQAGVQVDIWVRGICALRPGVPGPVREHPGALGPRPVPRALAGLPVRRRRRARRSTSAAPT